MNLADASGAQETNVQHEVSPLKMCGRPAGGL